MEDASLKDKLLPELADAGAVVEQTKGEIRGRWVDDGPPFPSTRV